MQSNHKYTDYSIENFINLIAERNLKKEDLVTSIKDIDVNEELISKTLQRVDFAYKRIDEPLESDVKFMLIFFPFGIISGFTKESFFSVEENRKLGFAKKIKEYHQYSFIGLALYLTIILTIVFF